MTVKICEIQNTILKGNKEEAKKEISKLSLKDRSILLQDMYRNFSSDIFLEWMKIVTERKFK